MSAKKTRAPSLSWVKQELLFYGLCHRRLRAFRVDPTGLLFERYRAKADKHPELADFVCDMAELISLRPMGATDNHAEWLADLIRTLPPSALESLFSDIITMRRNAAKYKSAMSALDNVTSKNKGILIPYFVDKFHRENGRGFTSKMELQRCIFEQAPAFGVVFPEPNISAVSKNAWTRILNRAGLGGL